jgi:hypothetical protein
MIESETMRTVSNPPSAYLTESLGQGRLRHKRLGENQGGALASGLRTSISRAEKNILFVRYRTDKPMVLVNTGVNS